MSLAGYHSALSFIKPRTPSRVADFGGGVADLEVVADLGGGVADLGRVADFWGAWLLDWGRG